LEGGQTAASTATKRRLKAAFSARESGFKVAFEPGRTGRAGWCNPEFWLPVAHVKEYLRIDVQPLISLGFVSWCNPEFEKAVFAS